MKPLETQLYFKFYGITTIWFTSLFADVSMDTKHKQLKLTDLFEAEVRLILFNRAKLITATDPTP